MKKLFNTLAVILLSLAAYAVPARPGVFTVRMADGTTRSAIMYGDEYWHCMTDLTGAILTETADGLYTLSDTNISQIDVHAKMRAARQSRPAPAQMKPANASTFSRAIVILVSFKDKSFSKTNASFTTLLNADHSDHNISNGSARDYFANSSNGAFLPQFDVYGPYTLDHNCGYYGGNYSGSGTDKNPMQMIVDAVSMFIADKGENALQPYDCDNDGYVDNVFVFYAGHGENAGGGANCIWPHRSYVYSSYVDGRTTYGGVTLGNYACTCELQGSSGSTMSGIGPFCHEFSHVLGLPDLYDTEYSGHRTLSLWDIMDAGNYLNNEHTPPAYSAYERFYLGWLTPEVLSEPDNIKLYDLNSTNSAKLISSTCRHNLDGDNPNPSEFYLLETRLQKGWDSYLQGQGMLITKVRYDYDKWAYNTVNNTASDMGVDIIEAGGVKGSYSQSSDPFPGSDNVTSYSPYTNQPLTDITLSRDYVSFRYKGGREKFSVAFDGMGRGTPAADTLIESAKGAGVVLPAVSRTDSGYTFEGWSYSASASSPDAGLPSERFYPAYDLTLFAVYSYNDTIQPTERGCLTETFDRCNKKTDLTNKMSSFSDLGDWYGSLITGNTDGSVKCGDNSTVGTLITPRLHISGDMTITMRCRALLNTNVYIKSEYGATDSTAIGTSYSDVTLNLDAVPVDSRLTISAGANIFFVDSVEFCGAKKSPIDIVEGSQYTLLRQGGYGVVTGLQGDEQVRVVDMTGRVIFDRQADAPEMRFVAPVGIYVVQISCSKGSFVLK